MKSIAEAASVRFQQVPRQASETQADELADALNRVKGVVMQYQTDRGLIGFTAELHRFLDRFDLYR